MQIQEASRKVKKCSILNKLVFRDKRISHLNLKAEPNITQTISQNNTNTNPSTNINNKFLTIT